MKLVTGGGGLIGSHIARALAAGGERVRVLDNCSSGARANLDGELRNPESVAQAMQGCDVVYHHAAVPSVPRLVADPRTTRDVGIAGALNVLLAARNAGTRRVVFALSSSIYVDSPVTPTREEMTLNPLSPYAISKLSAEQLCRVFTRLYGLEAVALRYFKVSGPNQDAASEYIDVIPGFIAAVAAGDRPVIYGDDGQTRNVAYVANVVDATLRAALVPKASGRVFNVASDRGIAVDRMLALIGELLGKPAEADHTDPRPADTRGWMADISAARAALRFVPTFSFEEGPARTVAAYVSDRVAA